MKKEHKNKISKGLKGNKNALGFKHTEETKKKIRLARIGISPSEEIRRKISQTQKGRKLTEEHKRKIGLGNKGKDSWLKGKKLSEEHRKKISQSHRGSKAYNYKGLSLLTKNIRECYKYRQWRSDVFTRDDFACQECNYKGYLEAHHIISFIDIIKNYNIKSIEEALNCQELWNINNGQTLCKKCHKKTDSYLYKNKN